MLTVFDCEQGSEEWFRARLGLPTASEFATIIASSRNGNESVGRKKYMRKLAGEIITGEPAPSYINSAMERGKAMEAEARAFYAFHTDADPMLVGLILNDGKGCSPDAILGKDGLLEIKTKEPHILIECIEQDTFPNEHKAQCQGALWISEREWIDLFAYWPKMPPFIKRAYRDDAYIKQLKTAIDKFRFELSELVERIRRYGQVS
jgi:hypothetical protein